MKYATDGEPSIREAGSYCTAKGVFHGKLRTETGALVFQKEVLPV